MTMTRSATLLWDELFQWLVVLLDLRSPWQLCCRSAGVSEGGSCFGRWEGSRSGSQRLEVHVLLAGGSEDGGGS